jgi:iron complex transport system substrate-binding protein
VRKRKKSKKASQKSKVKGQKAKVARIVSLIASATEIVHSLGQFEFLVGRSHECDFPAAVASLPVCTRPAIPVTGDSREIDRLVKDRLREAISVYEVFPDLLERLQPTHIITQTQCEVCAVSLKDVQTALAAGLSSNPQIVPLHPNALADVWDDMRRVAGALGIAEHGETTVETLKARMCAISRRALSRQERPTVACIEWLEPLMAAGNWVPELVEMAGGANLFGEAGKHSPWMSWEQLVEADPEVIVVMPCGWDPDRTRPEMHWLTDRPEWARLRAVRSDRVHLTDGNQYFNRPGPRLVESLEILATILHPL